MSLRNDFNDNVLNPHLADAVCFALASNHPEQAQSILAIDERISTFLIEKFCVALDENNIKLIHALYRSGLIDINDYNADGDTPLIHAIRSKTIKQETFSALLNLSNLDVNQKTMEGKPPILLATNPDKLHKLFLLLRHPDIDVNASDKDGFTALMESARHQDGIITSELLKHHDMNVNLQNKYGMTALMIMASFENPRIVDRMLNAPTINIRIKDHDGRTAYNHANNWGNIDTGSLIKSFEIK